jgi:hypothetical protein
MKVRWAAVCMAISLGLVVSGCSTPVATTHPLSARSTVTSYYAAVNAHRWTKASSLLSTSQRRESSAYPDSDRRNTVSVTGVRVKVRPAPPATRGDFPGSTHLQVALVTFDAVYRKVYGSASGPQVRFVYVGRQGAAGPWRILGIDTGP